MPIDVGPSGTLQTRMPSEMALICQLLLCLDVAPSAMTIQRKITLSALGFPHKVRWTDSCNTRCVGIRATLCRLDFRRARPPGVGVGMLPFA
eukprot:6486517-Amphidinium_carterae.1